ncbi:MAG: MFS transporter [Candidatus Omnitrophota bacterium]
MAKFSEVLKDKNFLFLWLGQIIAQFGDRLSQMALIAFVYSRAPGSTLAMAKLMSFTILPVFLIGPIAGAYVDRWDRRRTMFICDTLRGISVFMIPFFLLHKEPLVPVYLLVFLSFSISRFFVPAKMSIIPQLVHKSHLLLANSLVTTTGMIAAILGFGIGGILVSPNVLGVKGGFYLNSITFFISALFIFFIIPRSTLGVNPKVISKVGKEIVEVIRKSVISEIKDGLIYLKQRKDVRFIFGVFSLLWAVLGTVYIVSIVFIQEALQTITQDLGFLVIFLGAGLFCGSLLYGRFGTKYSHFKIIFFFLILSGLNLIIFTTMVSMFASLLVAMALSFILGLSISPIIVAANTLIHQLSDNSMMGRVFSSLEFVMHMAFLLFMFLSAYLAEFVSRFWILIGAGAAIAMAGILGFIKTKNGALRRT